MYYYVYILANRSNSTIYTGVTNDLLRRVDEHKQRIHPESFTARYHVDKLVFYEQTEDVSAAIQREKQIKSWSRSRKNQLIETMNPAWRDLWTDILE